MKLLLDENVPEIFKKTLSKNGHDVKHINNISKGSSDPVVFEKAQSEKRCIITTDGDFKDFRKKEHFGIIKYSGKIINAEILLSKVLNDYKKAGLKDLFILLGLGNQYKEIKKYTKKGVYKHPQRMPLKYDYTYYKEKKWFWKK